MTQNRALLDQIKREGETGREKVEEWEEGIRERELREKRRKAPGWLDREERILEPERKGDGDKGGARGTKNLMDEDLGAEQGKEEKKVGEKDVDDLGDAMDRAFGRSEMG